VLRWRQSRTGFVGAGLPAGRQDVNGIPAGDPVPGNAPLFMGFKSGLRRNQASEDAVTVTDGPFAGGTTMHVSHMRLRLDTWYTQLSQRERVARMYAPQITPEQAKAFTTDAASDPDLLEQAITRYGVIGHAQASARSRRGGRPVILRRDFDTTDGGLAGQAALDEDDTAGDNRRLAIGTYAGEHVGVRDPDLPGHGRRDTGVVAGEQEGAQTERAQPRHCGVRATSGACAGSRARSAACSG
jgi:hypothetical protein